MGLSHYRRPSSGLLKPADSPCLLRCRGCFLTLMTSPACQSAACQAVLLHPQMVSHSIFLCLYKALMLPCFRCQPYTNLWWFIATQALRHSAVLEIA